MADALAWRAECALILLLAASLVAVPAAGGQSLCQAQPDAPHFMDPSVDVSLPDRILLPLDADGPSETTFLVNVTYASNGTDTSDPGANVTVEPAPVDGFTVEGAARDVPVEGTVSVPVRVEGPAQAPASNVTLRLLVNTTGTNAHRPTSQVVDTELVVPLWIDADASWTWGTAGGTHLNVDVDAIRTNAPVDLLVTSPNHTADPAVLATSAIAGDGPIFEIREERYRVRMHGDPADITFSVVPVVEGANGATCFEPGTHAPVPVEGSASEGCLTLLSGSFGTSGQEGGVVGVVVLIAMGMLVLGMVGAMALGVFVLQRGGDQPPARALGIYLLTAGVSFALFASRSLVQEIFGLGVAQALLGDWVFVLVLFTVLVLGAAILTFALSYPTLLPRLRGSRAWLAIPVLPTLALALFLAESFTETWDHFRLEIPVIGIAYAGITAGLAAFLFHRRARDAETGLEADRLSFMLRSVALPLAATAAFLIGLFVIAQLEVLKELASLLVRLGMVPLALIPIAGMAWGVLKYEVVDLEDGLRRTLSRGFVGAAFIVAFFAVGEGAEALVSDAIGPYAGLAAAGLLTLGLAPLERFGKRIANRLVPEHTDSEDHERARRLEVYRATYEEATVDGELTDRERRTLASLADQLGLSEAEIGLVEDEVTQERGDVPGVAPAGST